MSRIHRFAVAIVASLSCAVALHGSAEKSATADELIHVTAGHSYWVNNDYRLQPENGNLTQRIIGLPNVIAGARFPQLGTEIWRQSNLWMLSENYFFGGANDADALLRRGRIAVGVSTAIVAIALFAISAWISGVVGAWITLLLFAFSPTILANGGLATSDIIASGCFVLAAFTTWRALERLTPASAFLATLSIAALLLSKYSAPILIPVVLSLAVFRVAEGRPLRIGAGGRSVAIRHRARKAGVLAMVAVAIAASVLLIIWGAYGFRYEAFNPGIPGGGQFNIAWTSLDVGSLRPAIEWLRSHRVLPEAYIYGLTHVLGFAEGRSQFLNGEVSVHGGWRLFFPYATMVKSTFAELWMMVLTLLVVIGLWMRRRRSARTRLRMRRMLPFMVLATWYWAFAVASPLNIGYRHMLPALLATFLMMGVAGHPLRQWKVRRLGAWNRDRRLWLYAAMIGAAVVWQVVESARIAPHFLAYFNAIAGGPAEGYKHLLDSSLDWGQDLPGLKKWLDTNNPASPGHLPVYLSYFGNAPPEHYGIHPVYLPGYPDLLKPRMPPPLTGGIYCISANMLQALYQTETRGEWGSSYERRYQDVLYNLSLLDKTASDPRARAALIKQTGHDFWHRLFVLYERLRLGRLTAYLRKREPDANVGYSILIFRLTDDEVHRALSEPILSPGPAGR